MSDETGFADLIAARRNFHIPGYATYADVGLDGPWVTPYQITSRSSTGPVLLTYNYLDAPSAIRHVETLRRTGYLPQMPFNVVLDLALALTGIERPDIYVTHAFHLLPGRRSETLPPQHVDLSFDTIARHELTGRRVIALGAVAIRACRRHGIPHIPAAHPSARGLSFIERAERLAAAIGMPGITCPSA